MIEWIAAIGIAFIVYFTLWGGNNKKDVKGKLVLITGGARFVLYIDIEKGWINVTMFSKLFSSHLSFSLSLFLSLSHIQWNRIGDGKEICRTWM